MGKVGLPREKRVGADIGRPRHVEPRPIYLTRREPRGEISTLLARMAPRTRLNSNTRSPAGAKGTIASVLRSLFWLGLVQCRF